MLKKLFCTLIIIPLCVYAKNPPMPISLQQSNQLILVITENWRANKGQLQYFQRENNRWRTVAKPWEVFVGQTGLAWSAYYRKFDLSGPYKSEGDSKSPAGAFKLTTSFGFAQNKDQAIKLKYIPLTKSTVCVADSTSKYYNQIINRDTVNKPDWRYQEIMRSIKQYQYGIVIDYNRPQTNPYYGSCVFVHIWDQPNSRGTAGCTSMSKQNLMRLLHWLNPKDNPVIVQLPQTQYQLLKKSWELP